MGLFKDIGLKLFFLCNAFCFIQLSTAQPVADFTATPVAGCAPLLVNFTDISTGSPTSWKWDLGDGTISVVQNPSKTYFTPGQYRITLIATNAAGSDTIVKNQFITVQLNPSANLSSDVTDGCLPLPVRFTDQSTGGSGAVVSWKWDFGDGITDSVKDPRHTYTSLGTFDVTLQVRNSFGCPGTISKAKYINTGNSAIAGFNNNVQGTCKPPVTLNFNNLSTGTGLTYQWTFGDGTGASTVNPSHTYATAGNFPVTLIARSAAGCSDTVIKNIVIGTVNADFRGPLSVCRGKLFSFTNTSAPVPAGAVWDFGDGTTSSLVSPSKIYNTPGSYTIKMTADFGACKDSVFKNITVLSNQAIAFTASDTVACKAPLTVNFTANVSGVSSYKWDFGDGSSSPDTNPVHIYTSPGNYSVSLITTNTSGCQDTLKKNAYINIQAPAVTLPDLPAKGCVPFTYAFTATLNSFDPAASYRWDFGDGTTSTAANPSHTFSTPGSYAISVTVTTANGCTATYRVAKGVIVGNKPSPGFTANPLSACASTPIQFTDLSTGNVDEWLWRFGDNTTATVKNPSHLYLDTGYFSVTLVAISSGCADSVSFSKLVYIKPGISIFTIRGNCDSLKVKAFRNASKGADLYEWDFGDGSPISTVRNPMHTFPDTGTYSVTLKVTNLSTGCVHTSTRPAQVVIEKAAFTADDTAICKNTTVVFKKQNINSSKITSFNWQFGDGSPAVNAVDSVSHTYNTAGDYSTRLIITNVLGCKDTLTKPQYIKVNGPIAGFTTPSQGACLDAGVEFIDSSLSDGVHPLVQWAWDYGDNTTGLSSGPPFRHTYGQEGTYTVKLKVTDSNGCSDSLVKANGLEILDPVADFIAQDTASCPSTAVQFTSLSTGANLVYEWDFGDGTTSDSANVSHVYTSPGTYTVRLKISGQYGCTDSISKANYISITAPEAAFQLSDSISACPPFFVNFTNASRNFTALEWDFGDGNFSSSVSPTHFYYVPGTYTVKLRATGPGGCFDETSGTIIVKGPVGIFTYTNFTGCDSVTTSFKASAKDNLLFTWDFNDGNTIKTADSSIIYTYKSAGFYLPRLILEDANGCQVPIVGTDSIKVFSAQSNFYAASTVVCGAGAASFTDSTVTNDSISAYLWDFGDGATSSQQNPVHSYAVPGRYTISQLVTTANGCRDSSSKPGYIRVVESPAIDILSREAACVQDTASFVGIFTRSDTAVVTWEWDFGNGQASTLQNPPEQRYPAAGTFMVTAIATNSSGCKDTATHSITIHPIPPTNAGDDAFLCLGTPQQLHGSGAASYEWVAPVDFLSCTTCATPYTSTPDDITYILKGTNAFNCSSLDSVTIRVKKPFEIAVRPVDSLCAGKSIQLHASGAENYVWSPAAALNNAFIPNPVANPAVSTVYTVSGYDDVNCFTDTANVSITVFNNPSVDAGADKNVLVGESVLLSPAYSGDVVNWFWSPPAGLSCTNCPAPTATPEISTTYTVTAINNGGCSATANVTVLVTCNSDNLFIPNTFSPNGDGVNDVFYPRGTGINKVRGMKIFNRWGQLVFERSNFYANDITAGWNGSVHGKKVPADVYTFVIDVICSNNDVISRSGNITLLK